MKIGFIGLGKLGLPVALAIERKGHEVRGSDPSAAVARALASRCLPYSEKEASTLLRTSRIELNSLEDLACWADMIFLAVQTPHGPEYEGATRLPVTRQDFDYSYLVTAVAQLDTALSNIRRRCIVIIISTVLPGTCEREILPIISSYFRLVYNPFFIAMGTVVPDFLHPEFVLMGSSDADALEQVQAFYSTIHRQPCLAMPLSDAELTKVAYNTWITAKITITNMFMEICEKVGGNIDNVMGALARANDRIVSNRYMAAGMGDGGSCHPRDNIALSWLAQKLDLSYDLFSSLMEARERQTDWLADLIATHPGPIYIFGQSFKEETEITTGSPAVLLGNILKERNIKFHVYDPVIGVLLADFKPGLYFIATRHRDFLSFRFTSGSVVLDPWGFIADQKEVKIIHIGRHYGSVRPFSEYCNPAPVLFGR